MNLKIEGDHIKVVTQEYMCNPVILWIKLLILPITVVFGAGLLARWTFCSLGFSFLSMTSVYIVYIFFQSSKKEVLELSSSTVQKKSSMRFFTLYNQKALISEVIGVEESLRNHDVFEIVFICRNRQNIKISCLSQEEKTIILNFYKRIRKEYYD